MKNISNINSLGESSNSNATLEIDNIIVRNSTGLMHQLLPKGIILMYNDINSIPSGWAICNGENETPDLTDKFIPIGDKSIIYIMKIV